MPTSPRKTAMARAAHVQGRGAQGPAARAAHVQGRGAQGPTARAAHMQGWGAQGPTEGQGVHVQPQSHRTVGCTGDG